MKRGTSTLGRCGHVLDQAAVMVGDTTCTDCRTSQILVAQRAGKPPVIRETEEWRVFVDALRRAAKDGEVHQDDVRALIRGRIYHKHIGQLYARARRDGVLVPLRKEQSGDKEGRNTHHASPVYELRLPSAA